MEFKDSSYLTMQERYPDYNLGDFLVKTYNFNSKHIVGIIDSVDMGSSGDDIGLVFVIENCNHAYCDYQYKNSCDYGLLLSLDRMLVGKFKSVEKDRALLRTLVECCDLDLINLNLKQLVGKKVVLVFKGYEIFTFKRIAYAYNSALN